MNDSESDPGPSRYRFIDRNNVVGTVRQLDIVLQRHFWVVVDTIQNDPYPLPGHSTLGILQFKGIEFESYTVPFGDRGLLWYSVGKTGGPPFPPLIIYLLDVVVV